MNGRQKGARGEREWAQWLRDHGFKDADRSARIGKEGAEDVVGGPTGTRAEVKRVEALNVTKAMEKVISEAGDDVPYVAHRRNRGEWLVTMRAEDWIRLYDPPVLMEQHDGERDHCQREAGL